MQPGTERRAENKYGRRETWAVGCPAGCLAQDILSVTSPSVAEA